MYLHGSPLDLCLSQHLIYYQKPIGEYLCCYSCSIEIILKGDFMWQEEQMSPLWCLIADDITGNMLFY